MNIYWLLCGGKNNPSSRIHGININNELVKRNYSSYLVHVPKSYTEDLIWPNFIVNIFIKNLVPKDIVIIQKLNGPRIIELVKILKKKSVKIVFIDCDLPLKLLIADLADLVIVPSYTLYKEYLLENITHSTIIPDAVEYFKDPEILNKTSRSLVWFGKSGLGKWELVQDFKKKILPEIAPNWNLITVSDHNNSDFKWSERAYLEIIPNFDLCVIPIGKSLNEQVKSANRCTQSLALGLPVVSNVIDSYKRVINNFENGLISNDILEWKLLLNKCQDLEYLNSIKKKAYLSSLEFSISKVVSIWIDVLKLEKRKRGQFSINNKLFQFFYSSKNLLNF